VFCDSVDIVSGIGWDKVDPDNPAYRFVDVHRVVSNLGVFDFNGPTTPCGRCRCTRGRGRQVAENTAFEVAGLDTADTTRLPSGAELELLRRSTRNRCATRRSRCELAANPADRTGRHRAPVVQTGMGWVAGARLVAATSNAGGLGILASATMTLDELRTAVAKVKAATDKPFGINIRADAADANDRVDLLIREGVKVASFALAPKPDLIARLKEAGWLSFRRSALPSTPRRWRLGCRRRDRAGRRGRRPHRTRRHHAAAAVGARRRRRHRDAGRRGGGSSTAAGWPPRCRTAPPASPWDPFLLTSDSTVPDDVKQRYLASALDGTVVSTRVDGMPHRVLRTGLVEKLESGSRVRGFTAAIGNAQKFKKMTGMTWRSMIRDGMAMRHGKDSPGRRW
jgi:hypothetical protein